ncbi:MAG: hypothetical protein J7621_23270 [Niastella sp.]|nr:hypothetical protein [Niastella sp.]
MKLRKINIATAVALATTIAFVSCSKDDGAIPKNVNIESVPAVTINLEAGGFTANVNVADLPTFQGKFKTSMYFDNATPPTKIDIVARKRNGVTGAAKVFKADVATLPASFTITSAEMATLLGALAAKDTIEIAPDIYVGSKKYEAFPASGVAGSGSGVIGMSGVNFGERITYYIK